MGRGHGEIAYILIEKLMPEFSTEVNCPTETNQKKRQPDRPYSKARWDLYFLHSFSVFTSGDDVITGYLPIS